MRLCLSMSRLALEGTAAAAQEAAAADSFSNAHGNVRETRIRMSAAGASSLCRSALNGSLLWGIPPSRSRRA